MECFDADAAKVYLRRSLIEFIAWLVSFVVLSAIAVSLFCVYGVNTVIQNRQFFLWFAICFIVIGVGGLLGSVFSLRCYLIAKRTVQDSGMYIDQVSAARAEQAMDAVSYGLRDVLFASRGYYYNDIDEPFVLRKIGDKPYSSNYQVSVLYVDGNTLYYRSAVFSLLSGAERVLNGAIPVGTITHIGIIKSNGIDLFCAHLKVVFATQCILFALNEGEDYRKQLCALREAIKGEEDNA